MDNDDGLLTITLKGFLYTALVVFLCLILGFGAWRFWLAWDTSQQGAIRHNHNVQANQQIANNAYMHSLLAQIETDKTDIQQFDNFLETFCQINGLGQRTHDSCSNVKRLGNLDYNTQQEYERDQTNVDAAYESLSSNVNAYNSYADNSDTSGLDGNLPKHINSDGSYTDVNGTRVSGVQQ